MKQYTTKKCTRCGIKKEATPENFFRCAARVGGYSIYCKDCDKHYRRKDYKKNREAILQRNRKWWAENPSAVRDIKKRHRTNNIVKVRKGNAIRLKRWVKRHPEQVKMYTAIRRARVRSAEGSHTKTDIIVQYQSQEGKCFYCGIELFDTWHLDHMMPLIKGGTNNPDNLCCACSDCNLQKGVMTIEEWELVRGW